jgi:hypothetical protein
MHHLFKLIDNFDVKSGFSVYGVAESKYEMPKLPFLLFVPLRLTHFVVAAQGTLPLAEL